MFGVAANPADTAVSGAAKQAAAADALEVVVGCPVVVRRISAHSRRYMSPNGGFGRCFDRRGTSVAVRDYRAGRRGGVRVTDCGTRAIHRRDTRAGVAGDPTVSTAASMAAGVGVLRAGR